MSTSRSHLVKSTIVDKNGIVTSRLTKPDSGQTMNTPPIPPVASPAQPSSMKEYLDTLHHLIHGDWEGADQYRDLLDVLYEDDPDTISLALWLYDTGSDASHAQLRNILKQTLKNMFIRRMNNGEGWRDDENDRESPHVKHSLLCGWHSGALAEEIKSDVNPIDIAGRAVEFDYSLHGYDGSDRSSMAHYYWRGLAMMSAARLRLTSDIRVDAREFIKWSETQTDPALVVQIIKDRNTLNVATISGIMAEYRSVTPGLRDGLI